MVAATDGWAGFLERVPRWAWTLPVALLLVIGARAGIRLARWILARRSARARRIGERGARLALDLLVAKGFRILETEAVREGTVEVDGACEPFVVRVDALVARRGHVFVAEAKGGEVSASIRDRATRRQLLEYAHVFGAAGVLLVDGRAGKIHVVRFPPPAVREAPGTRR